MSCEEQHFDQRNEGLLVSVSGPSGVGKGTVIQKVRELFPEVAHSVSITTREKRTGEKEGVSYFYKTHDEFKELNENGEILESDVYLTNRYGTPLSPLLKMIREGKDVLFDLTVAGSLTLMEKFENAVTIFLLPPSMCELKKRLEVRGTETQQVIEERIAEAVSEIPKAKLFKYVIINNDVEQTANSILAIIKAEKHKYSRQNQIEERILNS